jgi:hypothetical protein
LAFDPTKHRRIVVVDVLDVTTGQHQGQAVEFLIPRDETPGWVGHPTAEQVRAWLAQDVPVPQRPIVTKARPGLDQSQRLLAVVKELKGHAALAAWRSKRGVKDAPQARDEARARQ